jgi:hypothetical protein
MTKVELVNKVAKAIDNAKTSKALLKGAFSPLDKAFESAGDSTKKDFLDLLNKAEEKIKKLRVKNEEWWMAEIYFRKGRYAKGLFEKPREYRLWKDAYDYALKGDNYEVTIQSGLSLGFEFYEFTSSIKEILAIHINCIKAVCAQGDAIHTRLRIIGINLFNFWRQIEFRRLSESELKAKQYVIDGAKNLEGSGFDEDRAAPIMILLISKVYGFTDPCLEWAQLESAIIDIRIPDDIKQKIGIGVQ